MSDETIEIVVTAPRIQGALSYPVLPPWINFYVSLPRSFKADEWLFGPYLPNVYDYTAPDHLKKMIIQVSIESFANVYNNLEQRLLFMDSNKVISLGYAYTMTVGQLLEKLRSVQFHIYDKNFAGPGYGGANYGNRVEINWDAFAGYTRRDAYGSGYGANYLILHEIAHNTALGLASRSWAINSYRDDGSLGFYGGENTFFKQQERAANTIALNIASEIGIFITSPSEPNFPPHGFTSFD